MDTSGVLKGDLGTTSTAGDDTFKATAADFQALDNIDGGDGVDTLSVVDTAAFAGFAGATIAGIEKVSISSSGAVGGIQVLAGTDTAAVANVRTITPGTVKDGASDTYTLSVNGVNYSVSVTAAAQVLTKADVGTALKNELIKIIGDQATFGTVDGTTGAFTITSNIAGTALPTISAVGAAAAQTVANANTTANVVATGGAAVKQMETITFTDAGGAATDAADLSAGDVITVYIAGVKYSAALVPDATGAYNNAALATQVASIINGALGAGTAVAGGNVVTLTAPTAGTALPLITTAVSNATDFRDSYTVLAANQALNAAAVSAVTVAAPTGATEYKVVAGGDANVTGVSTSAIDVTGAAVRSSGGTTVKVAASSSVYVSGASSTVSITETAVNPTKGFYVASSTTTGLSGGWGTATALKGGTLVTGGTNVSITGAGGTATTGGAVDTTDASAVQVGSAANVGVSSANLSTGKETILNSALAATGDVTVSSSTRFTRVDDTNKLTLSSVIYGAGDTKVYMNGGTTASVTGANSVLITDLGTTLLKPDAAGSAVAGTSKLTTATVNGLNGEGATATINSDALTNLTVMDARGATSLGVTVNNNTAGHALNLTVGNSGTSSLALTVTDSKATTVNIASAASSFQALGNAAINSGSASYVTLNTALATAINMTNAQEVNLGDLTGAGYAKVATINASGASGAVNATIGAVPVQGLTFTGGAGNDTVTLKDSTSQSANATSSATLTVNLGAGNDALVNGGTAVHTVVGAKFDGGSGTDTVAATLINAGNAAQFVNFEILGLDVANGGSTYDASLLSGATGLALIRNVSLGTVTYSNVKAAQGLTVATSVNANGTTALGFETAVISGTSDSYTITFAGTGAVSPAAAKTTINAGNVSLTGIETVNVVSGGTGYTNNTITLVDASAKSLVISGSQFTTVTTGTFGTQSDSTNGLGVSSVDASANTAGVNIDLTHSGFESAYASLAIKGSAGGDTITLGNFDALSVTVDAGAGDDTIVTASSKAAALTGGAGADTFNVAATVYGSGSLVTTITDFAKTDKIAFADVSGTSTFTATAVDVATATTLAAALNLAAGTAVGANAASIKWFTYGGNTYVVQDLSSSTSLDTTTDIVVKLSGVLDLSTSTYAATDVLTFA